MKKFFYGLTLFIFLAPLFTYFALQNNNSYHKNIEFSTEIKEFYKSGEINEVDINRLLKTTYSSGNILKNGDFSKGLMFWAISGISEHFSPPPLNKLNIDYKDFTSFPCSLKITAIEYPCRLFYTKEKDINFIRNPWNFRKGEAWFKIPANSRLNVSMYYKGAKPTVSICSLNKLGFHGILTRKIAELPSKNWKKFEFSCKIPDNIKAILLEIQVTSLTPNTSMSLDDISVEVLND